MERCAEVDGAIVERAAGDGEAQTIVARDVWDRLTRIVYQRVKADGFNRQEFYNLYSN